MNSNPVQPPDEPEIQIVVSPHEAEISDLKHALTAKTVECKLCERKLARQTRQLNQQDAYITKLEEDQRAHIDERLGLLRSLANLNQANLGLKDQLGMKEHLEWTQEYTRKLAVTLSSALAVEERACKRQRA